MITKKESSFADHRMGPDVFTLRKLESTHFGESVFVQPLKCHRAALRKAVESVVGVNQRSCRVVVESRRLARSMVNSDPSSGSPAAARAKYGIGDAQRPAMAYLQLGRPESFTTLVAGCDGKHAAKIAAGVREEDPTAGEDRRGRNRTAAVQMPHAPEDLAATRVHGKRVVRPTVD